MKLETFVLNHETTFTFTLAALSRLSTVPPSPPSPPSPPLFPPSSQRYGVCKFGGVGD